MAYLGKTFNTAEMPFQDSYDPLPAGEYEVVVTETDLKRTKQNTGEYIECKLKVIGPTHANRVVYDRLIVGHQNPQAEEIGLKRFNGLIRATGQASVNDTDQLLNKRVIAKLKISPAREGYDASNDVLEYKAVQGSAAPMPTGNDQPDIQPAKKPWEL